MRAITFGPIEVYETVRIKPETPKIAIRLEGADLLSGAFVTLAARIQARLDREFWREFGIPKRRRDGY